MTGDAELRQRVRVCIKDAYQDMDAPHFAFVLRAMKRRPHASVVAELAAAGWTVEDTTDENEDVALHLVLRRHGAEVGVALSLVGPFVRTTPMSGAPSWMQELERILQRSDLTMVPPHMLNEPTPLQLDGAAASVDEALFAA